MLTPMFDARREPAGRFGGGELTVVTRGPLQAPIAVVLVLRPNPIGHVAIVAGDSAEGSRLSLATSGKVTSIFRLSRRIFFRVLGIGPLSLWERERVRALNPRKPPGRAVSTNKHKGLFAPDWPQHDAKVEFDWVAARRLPV